MRTKLLFRALAAMLAGLILMGLMLFLPAGTIAFPGAWRLLGALFIPMLILGVFLLTKSPELLKKRLSHKENQSTQKRVVGLSGLLFAAGFIAAGLDFRFNWTQLPQWLSWAATGVFLLGYGMYAEVMRENAYLSRTIEVQQGQKVIDTGLYSIVRHPMYSATVLMFLSMPMVLGSLISLICLLPYPLLIAARIRNEEAVLEAGLEGYAEYKQRVKHRLIPFIF